MPDNYNSKQNVDYDEEPVEYCSKCFSLKIVHENLINSDCCMDCGSTDMAMTDIHTWERLYEKRYGRKFVKRNNDPRASIYFKLPISTLKTKLYQDDRLLGTVLHRLYPKFPEGLNTEEKILVLFDKVSRENRMDDLRMAMYDYYKAENHF